LTKKESFEKADFFDENLKGTEDKDM